MVISTGMLHSLKNPVGVFREIHRVLKNGGQAWVYDPANLGSHHLRKEWKASLALHEKFFLWLFTSLKIHQPAKTLSHQNKKREKYLC
jgi:SAM-dependent methyltransferase